MTCFLVVVFFFCIRKEYIVIFVRKPKGYRSFVTSVDELKH